MLKPFLLSLVFLFSLSSTFAKSFHYNDSNDDKKIIVIDVGSEEKTSKKDLEKRIYRLEKAVRQLQDRVFDLEVENSDLRDDNKKKFTCYIKTNMKGTFTSTQKSLTQAKADVMKKCSDEIKFGFECDEDKVKCGE
ncbi:MAG: hypothetical protein ACK4VO_08785 [Pseudobdellovibrio sp.]